MHVWSTTPQSHSQSLWPVFVIGHRHTGKFQGPQWQQNNAWQSLCLSIPCYCSSQVACSSHVMYLHYNGNGILSKIN